MTVGDGAARAGEGAAGARWARPHELPRWLWLWFPPVLIIVQLALHTFAPAFHDRYVVSETGLVENATVLVCLTAVIGGLLALRYRAALPHRLLAAWIAVVTLGAFYFGGEELSWEQRLAGWDTPETLGAFNDQNETNIHNISSWFDQKPRLALELWVLFGGVIYGLRRWISPGTAPPPGDWRHWFWPTATCVPVSVLAIVVRLGERLKDWFGMPIPPAIEIRASETQEYCFALFLVIYLWSLHVRLRTRANADR